MSAAGEAFGTALVTVSLAAAVGYGIYRLAMPTRVPIVPLDIGRKWFAWMAMIITVSALPPFFRTFGGVPIAKWAIDLVFFGGLAFGCGWLYGRLFTFKNGKKEEPTSLAATSRAMPNDKHIFCSQCGTQIEIVAKFCSKCGAAVINSAATLASVPLLDPPHKQFSGEPKLQKNAEVLEVERCTHALAQLDYKVIVRAKGWEIKEPLGGRQKIESLVALTQYTNERLNRR